MILTVTANAAIDKRYVVERFGTGNVNRVKSCAANAGGKGINVSRVASLLGTDITATGFWADTREDLFRSVWRSWASKATLCGVQAKAVPALTSGMKLQKSRQNFWSRASR